MTKIAEFSGRFWVGCNYWASHAGINMWTDWRPEVVEADLEALCKAGMGVLRVFPLWPVFQPISVAAGPVKKEYLINGQARPNTKAGRAGVSEQAIQRFDLFLNITEKYDLKIIIGLITGWMSGRCFVPPALEGKPLLTDPLAISWQQRFIKYFVDRFKDHKSIIGWNPGNECNVLGAETNAQAAMWCGAIVDAIRSVDNQRPVIAGMHGISADPGATWSLTDQGEFFDYVTTHPYSFFVPHCDSDPLNTIRTGMHPAAESTLYSNVSGKPCLAEELGTLGPNIVSGKIAADFLRTQLFSTWAHGQKGLLWWCAFDQDHLDYPPYEWIALERELGLLKNNRTPKPALGEMTKFTQLLKNMPFTELPAHITDAVCILSEDQDHWAVAYATFILAKQAGFDIQFRHQSQSLPDAKVYLLPSITGANVINRSAWLDLCERVKKGARLYISCDNGFLSGFEAVTGMEIQTRRKRRSPGIAHFDKFDLPITMGLELELLATRAEVLAKDDNGLPIFSRGELGAGEVYFLGFPMEMQLTKTPGVFDGDKPDQFWRVYQTIINKRRNDRVATKRHPQVGITEHIIDQGSRVVVLINYSPSPVESGFKLSSDWQIKDTFYGDADKLAANDAAVIMISKNNS